MTANDVDRLWISEPRGSGKMLRRMAELRRLYDERCESVRGELLADFCKTYKVSEEKADRLWSQVETALSSRETQ
jgi:hypothetical protein